MISLTTTQSLLACCLVLVVGRVLTSKIGFLSRYSIPDPIVGGLLFALLTYALVTWAGIQVSLETSIKSTFLLVFFCCIGLTADLKLLQKGGPRLIALLIVLVPYLLLQNVIGLSLAKLLDMHPLMGLLGGTITLVGGHGTGAAYASRFADVNNIQDVMALAMTAATIGLVIGGVLGGPVAEWLIKRHKLGSGYPASTAASAAATDQATAVVHDTKIDGPTTSANFIISLTVIFVALVGGGYLATLVDGAPISLPNFLWCLIIGIIIRNGGTKLGLRLDDRTTDLIGTVALSLFLGMTMMTMDLSSVARLVGPLALMLIAQTIACAAYAIFIVFRTQKRDYEAAIMAAAFCGFAMGATATAIANMQALTRRHGPAPQAFIVVPVTGAFLIDIMNVIILTSLISLPFVGGM